MYNSYCNFSNNVVYIVLLLVTSVGSPDRQLLPSTLCPHCWLCLWLEFLNTVIPMNVGLKKECIKLME